MYLQHQRALIFDRILTIDVEIINFKQLLLQPRTLNLSEPKTPKMPKM